MSENPRIDLLIARQGRTLLVVLVVVGLLAVAAAGYVVATPSTTQVTEDVNVETVSTDVETSAVVQDDRFWDQETVLSDRSMYLLQDTPELTLETTTSAPTDTTVVDHEVSLHYTAENAGETFWETTEPVDAHSPDVEDGEARSTTTIDMPAVYDEYTDLQDDFDGVGSIDVALVVVTEYDTGTYADTLEGETDIDLSTNFYRLEDRDALSQATDHSSTQTVDVPESPNVGLVGLLAGVGLLGFAAAAFVYSRADIDEEAARLAVHRQRYADWISRGSLPMWVGNHHIKLDSLEDVVDVAIDTNERVVHDEQRDLFAVLDTDVVYYYSRRGMWEETAWPAMTFSTREQPEGPVEEIPPIEESQQFGWTESDADGGNEQFLGQDDGEPTGWMTYTPPGGDDRERGESAETTPEAVESPELGGDGDQTDEAGTSEPGTEGTDDDDGPDFDDEDTWREF